MRTSTLYCVLILIVGDLHIILEILESVCLCVFSFRDGERVYKIFNLFGFAHEIRDQLSLVCYMPCKIATH
jgi:hypothetical protein